MGVCAPADEHRVVGCVAVWERYDKLFLCICARRRRGRAKLLVRVYIHALGCVAVDQQQHKPFLCICA